MLHLTNLLSSIGYEVEASSTTILNAEFVYTEYNYSDTLFTVRTTLDGIDYSCDFQIDCTAMDIVKYGRDPDSLVDKFIQQEKASLSK